MVSRLKWLWQVILLLLSVQLCAVPVLLSFSYGMSSSISMVHLGAGMTSTMHHLKGKLVDHEQFPLFLLSLHNKNSIAISVQQWKDQVQRNIIHFKQSSVID